MLSTGLHFASESTVLSVSRSVSRAILWSHIQSHISTRIIAHAGGWQKTRRLDIR